MTVQSALKAAAALCAAGLLAQPALAQTVTCAQLAQLQEQGKDHFSAIKGAATYPGSAESTFLLDGAESCSLDFLDTTYPKFNCIWSGFADEQSAEQARLELKRQVLACMPQKFKARDRQTNLSGSNNFYTQITFGGLQPKITMVRRYSKIRHRFTVEFSFDMQLYEE